MISRLEVHIQQGRDVPQARLEQVAADRLIIIPRDTFTGLGFVRRRC
jgi:hypothetical protein